MLQVHLNKFINDNNLIRNEQFGFREGHSTQHQILRITEHVTQRFNWKQNTGAALLGVEKAFDSVWINGLLRKLIELKFPKWMIFFLNSYLKNRSFTVKLDNTFSTEREIKAGVPQGSLIGPTIFNLNINDMPTTAGVNIGVYADDTVLYTSSLSDAKIVKELNKALILIKDWCAKWRIKINASKSEAILFGYKQTSKPLNHPDSGTLKSIGNPTLNISE